MNVFYSMDINNFYSNANGHKKIGVHQMNAVADIQSGKYGL